MPLNAALCSVYRGINPPPNPSVSTLWISQSVKTLQVSDSYTDRTTVLTGSGGTFESNVVQEPKVYYNTVLNRWDMLYTGTTAVGLASATFPKGPWTKFSTTQVIGSGQGGFAGTLQHSRLYIEGTTLYLTFPDQSNNVFKLATADMSAPQTWTVVGTIFTPPASSGFSSGNLGNCKIVKVNGIYYLFWEALITSNGFQMGVASCATVSGTYGNIVFPLPSLWSTNKTGAGTAGPTNWLPIEVGGTTYYIPLFGA